MEAETLIIMILMCLLMISSISGVIIYFNFYKRDKISEIPDLNLDEHVKTYHKCPKCPECPECQECPKCPEYQEKICPPSYVSGRYVYLIGKYNKLLISKVEVYDIHGTLISKNKNVSGFSSELIYGKINDVVDGNFNGDIQLDNSRIGNNTGPVYIEIDLGTTYRISKIILYTKDNINNHVNINEVGIKDDTSVVFSSNNIQIPSKSYLFAAPFINNNAPTYIEPLNQNSNQNSNQNLN